MFIMYMYERKVAHTIELHNINENNQIQRKEKWLIYSLTFIFYTVTVSTWLLLIFKFFVAKIQNVL